MWQDLEEANAEREKYEANRKELIANISHDLKKHQLLLLLVTLKV